MTDVPEKLPSMAGVNADLTDNVRIDTRKTAAFVVQGCC